jgi:glycosyltransferase involved in cell wall biosynthesis
VRQPLTVHQFHFSAAPHDAVYNQMVFLQAALREVHIDGDLFACEIKPGLEGKVQPFASALWDCDLLLIHHSHGNPLLKEVLKVEVPKALVYHNITPAEFFPHDPYVADLCRLGRSQLELFPNKIVESFADSRFNAKELESYGLRAQLLPLFHLNAKIPVNRVRSEKKNILFVGRMVPHKNQALVIRAFAYFLTLEPKSQLTLVGGQDPIYGEYLRLLISALNLQDNVRLLGKVSDAELTRLYRESGAFLCLSQHEGFCIPLIEAMKNGIPVFASARGAVGETLGGAGVELISEHPKDIAAVLAAVLKDRGTLDAILRGQAKRLGELGRLENKKTAQGLLGRLVKKLRSPPSARNKRGVRHSSKATLNVT